MADHRLSREGVLNKSVLLKNERLEEIISLTFFLIHLKPLTGTHWVTVVAKHML